MLLVILLLTRIDITAELHKDNASQQLTVGDPFDIDLTLTYPQGTDISSPFVDSIDPFMILDQEHTLTQEKGTITDVYTLHMVAFGTGELRTPAFKFLHTVDDTVDTLQSNPVSVTIASVLPDDMADINDLKEAVEFPNFMPLVIAGIVVACAIIGFLAYKLYTKLKRTRLTAKPATPPWVEALVHIENIPIKEWLEKGLVKKYYYTLSEILKWYIERRFLFNAAEQTTTEIIAAMKIRKTPMREEFGRFFNRADLVKYAKFVPPNDELRMAADEAKALVTKTKPEEPAESKT
jgi:hypothetical protein